MSNFTAPGAAQRRSGRELWSVRDALNARTIKARRAGLVDASAGSARARRAKSVR
jgi:hypothetical protein